MPAFAVETIGGVSVHDEPSPVPVPKSEQVAEPAANGVEPGDDSPPAVASGGVARPTTKAERRAARERRKHGRK